MNKSLLRLVLLVGLLAPVIAWGQSRTINGRITDEDNSPLAGASVQVKSQRNIGVAATSDGYYSLSVPAGTNALVFSYAGKDEKEVRLIQGVDTYNVTLTGSLVAEEVVVNAGIMTREAATFTGSVKTVSQAELKEAGFLNPLTALSTIDPSFALIENNLAGSNPNALPTFELNGKTSVDVYGSRSEFGANPNEPLFVLDGFDTTLEKINNMDINQIASITILKDAGSTAIYGAKGANGVVVVETVKPKPGQLMVNYSVSSTVSVADLSAYNLMNAQEKLDFEVLSGWYDNEQATPPIRYDSPLNGSSYWSRYEQVKKGVDTYWLKYPLRTGISHQHHLSISGGEEKLNYKATVGYNKKVGVMKGSNHENVSGNVFLQYRFGRVNVSNDMNFTVTNSQDGSYGSFQSWADMSPYFKPYDDDGRLQSNVNPLAGGGGSSGDFIGNPLYNASLYTDNIGKATEFLNNTKFEYMASEIGFRLNGGLSLSRLSATNENFKDPRHTDYRTVSHTQAGSFTYGSSNEWKWSGNISASLMRTLADAHYFTFVARAQADNVNLSGTSYTSVGFPRGTKPNPSRAYQYEPGSHPSYNKYVNRSVAFLFSMNYNYMAKYLFDFNINRDGSTSFGKNNPFTTNWSVGAGWNVMQENFTENWTWADNIKLRGSYGTNSNQNKDMLASNVYRVLTGMDYFGMATVLDGVANPNLDWQKTTKLSAGIDLKFLDERLAVTFEVYSNKTDPQAISLPEPPSTGVEDYDVNMGRMESKGWAAYVQYAILRRPEDRLRFSVNLSAAHSNQKFSGFGEAFERMNADLANSLDIDLTNDDGSTNYEELNRLNEVLNNNVMLKRYKDGNDPDALWAVRSLGIDPGTGREVFMGLDGRPTFIYNVDDAIAYASTRAKVHGTVGFVFTYKNFRSSINFQYAWGGYAFNNALFSKVEKILSEEVLNNQDKRALYDRWQKAGDIARFRSIRLSDEDTSRQVSTRFIQKNNYINASSIQLGWDFSNSRFVEQVGLRTLSANVTMNDIFRISTIKQERGVEYPFARAVIFSLSTSF